MEESLFIEWVEKWFPGIVVRTVETLNDTKRPLTYLHRRMLRKDFSITGKWQAISVSNTLVAADVVSLDSPLPLKKRDKISTANGDIAKMGMELYLNETQLTELDTLIAQGATEAQVVAKLFQDTPKCIGGVYERLEGMFLEGLSTGVTLVEDDDTNTGTGVRLDYGYLPANKFESTVPFGTTGAKPFTDMQPMLDKADLDGNTISIAMCDRATFNNIAKSDEAKELYAASVNFFGANIPVPTFDSLNRAVQDRYGFRFELVDRSVRYEKNGKQVTRKPFKSGNIVFLVNDQVGTITYARLAEQNHPVESVTYQTVDDFILVSKYHLHKPALSEWTSSQARVVPVINNVDQIYLMDTTQSEVEEG